MAGGLERVGGICMAGGLERVGGICVTRVHIPAEAILFLFLLFMFCLRFVFTCSLVVKNH